MRNILEIAAATVALSAIIAAVIFLVLLVIYGAMCFVAWKVVPLEAPVGEMFRFCIAIGFGIGISTAIYAEQKR